MPQLLERLRERSRVRSIHVAVFPFCLFLPLVTRETRPSLSLLSPKAAQLPMTNARERSSNTRRIQIAVLVYNQNALYDFDSPLCFRPPRARGSAWKLQRDHHRPLFVWSSITPSHPLHIPSLLLATTDELDFHLRLSSVRHY